MKMAGKMRVGPWLFFAKVLLQLLAECVAMGTSETITIVTEPSDLELKLNSNALLQCSVSDLPQDHHIVWIHNDNPIFEDDVALGGASNRYRTVGTGTSRNLAIEPVAKEDHGSVFLCRINNGSLLLGGNPKLVAESRTATMRVLYGPPAEFPSCYVRPDEMDGQVNVMLSCCTQVASIPLSLSWMAHRESISGKVTQATSTGSEVGHECVDFNTHAGLNFTSYECQLSDASGKLPEFKSVQCKVSKLSQLSISLRYLDHKNAEFNCSVRTAGTYQYLWHLQDEDKTTIQQVSSLSSQSSLVLKLNKVSNGSHLSCSVFEKVKGYSMGISDLKIVLSAPPEEEETPTMLIVGTVVGLVAGILVCSLSMYFLLIKWKRRNDRLYASLERSSEIGMQVGQGSPSYIYLKNGPNGPMNGMVITAEGDAVEIDPKDIPPKPGGHRTISWEPEDLVIRSNGGVINHSGDRKRRNIEGLVYADLAFQEQEEEEQDAETDGESDETLKGAVGGEVSGSKDGTLEDRENIQYASIVPPPRSLRF